MGRGWVFAVIVLMLSASNLSAQIIVCPGTLPVSEIQKETTAVSAERLLKRFMAAFGLHALSKPGRKEHVIEEKDVIERYKDHPDQLLTKLNYLAVQCQMLLIERPDLRRTVQQEAIRRTFLDYILSKPDPDATSLTKVIDDATAKARADEVDPLIRGDMEEIENALAKSDRRKWKQRWFPESPPDTERGPDQQRSVITASPCYEDEGWRMLRAHQACWPDAHFELHGPIDPQNPYYAIVAGYGLTKENAEDLLNRAKDAKMPQDAFAWQPKTDEPSEPDEKPDADQKSKTMWCAKKPDGAEDWPDKKASPETKTPEEKLKAALCGSPKNSS
jgi:hypothetical protein